MATQKIASFNKQTARTVADALIEAMKPVAASMGIVLEKNGGSIESDITAVLKFKAILSQKKAPSLEAAKQAEWTTHCLAYGLQPSHFGMKIDLPRSKATTILWEIQPRRSAKPIIVRAENGKLFAIPLEYVMERIGATKPAKKSTAAKSTKPSKPMGGAELDAAKKAFAKKMAAARAAKRAEREDADESTNARKSVKRRQAAAKGGAAKAERTRQQRKVSSEKADEPKLTRAEKRAKAERAAKRAERKAKREAAARKAERSSSRNTRSTTKREAKPARAARGTTKRTATAKSTGKVAGKVKRRNRMA